MANIARYIPAKAWFFCFNVNSRLSSVNVWLIGPDYCVFPDRPTYEMSEIRVNSRCRDPDWALWLGEQLAAILQQQDEDVVRVRDVRRVVLALQDVIIALDRESRQILDLLPSTKRRLLSSFSLRSLAGECRQLASILPSMTVVVESYADNTQTSTLSSKLVARLFERPAKGASSQPLEQPSLRPRSRRLVQPTIGSFLTKRPPLRMVQDSEVSAGGSQSSAGGLPYRPVIAHIAGPVREFRLCPMRGCPYLEAGDSHHVTGHIRSAHGEVVPYVTRILKVEEWLAQMATMAIQQRYSSVQNPFEKQPGWSPSVLKGWRVALFRPEDDRITPETRGYVLISGFKWPRDKKDREMFTGLKEARSGWERLVGKER